MALATDVYDDPTAAAGHAYLLSEGQTRVDMTMENRDAYQAIAAVPADLDNDGDNDFVVLARNGGIDGRETTANDRRVRFYINVPCNGPGGRCLLVKHLDGFDSVSGDALAWAQSPPEATYFAAGERCASRTWWLGAVTGNTTSGTGAVRTTRVRVEGCDENMTFTVLGDSTSEAALPTARVSFQHVAWGDFDGDTALDLLYVSDLGSRMYRRATRTR
jgi:hypothetical protein